jgi:hypothetical protein
MMVCRPFVAKIALADALYQSSLDHTVWFYRFVVFYFACCDRDANLPNSGDFDVGDWLLYVVRYIFHWCSILFSDD